MKLNLLSYTEQQTMPKASEEAEILTFLQRLLTTKFQKGPLGPLWRLEGRKFRLYRTRAIISTCLLFSFFRLFEPQIVAKMHVFDLKMSEMIEKSKFKIVY